MKINITFKDRNATIYRSTFPDYRALVNRLDTLRWAIAEDARHTHFGATTFLYCAEVGAIEAALSNAAVCKPVIKK